VADREIADEDFIELRVEQRPAALVRLPVFADPVILELPWVEVGAEAASASGRHAVMAEDRDGEQHEVAADADQPPFGRTGDVERLSVERQQRFDHPRHRPDVALGAARLGKRAAVKAFRDVLVDQKPLDGTRDARRIGRQSVQQCGLAARSAEGRLARIIGDGDSRRISHRFRA
jgi:hypothetical protein